MNHPKLFNPLPFRIILIGVIAFFVQETAFGQPTARIKYSNTYVNLSKKNVGGTVEPGDTLEIRTCIYLSTSFNGGRAYFMRYLDNIPLKTDTIRRDSLRLITNEGLTYKRYTLNPNDPDAGGYIKTPPAGHYQVRINMGGLPTAPNPGNATNNSITDLTGSSDIRAAVLPPPRRR
jgi:hypothetical protein